MNAIVLVDDMGGIGKDGILLYNVKKDMIFFRVMTMGMFVIVGRSTFEGFPGKEPLPNRMNIILTRDKSYLSPYAIVAHSIDELDSIISRWNTDDFFVIGGASIYEQLLDKCDKVYINRLHVSCYKKEEIDAFFPDFDEVTTLKEDKWKLIQKRDEIVEYMPRFKNGKRTNRYGGDNMVKPDHATLSYMIFERRK